MRFSGSARKVALVSGGPGDLVGLGIGHRVEDLRHLLGDQPVDPGPGQVLVDLYDVRGVLVPSPVFQSRFFVLANENRTQDAGHALLRQGGNPKVRKNSGVITSPRTNGAPDATSTCPGSMTTCR